MRVLLLISMKRIIKILAMGTLLIAVSPLNFVELGLGAEGEKADVKDKGENSILAQRLDDVRKFANEKKINIDKIRGEFDKSDMLGPKYNGGSLKDAIERVEKISKQSPQLSKGSKNALSIFIELVSIGKRHDFDAGKYDMLEAINSYIYCDKTDKKKVDEVIKAKRLGYDYMAGFVAQEMLINLRDGKHLVSLEGNYKDACAKLKAFLEEKQSKVKNKASSYKEIKNIALELKCSEESLASIVNCDLTKFDIYDSCVLDISIEKIFGKFIDRKNPNLNTQTSNSVTLMKYFQNKCVEPGINTFLEELKKEIKDKELVERIARIEKYLGGETTDCYEVADSIYEIERIHDKIKPIREEIFTNCKKRIYDEKMDDKVAKDTTPLTEEETKKFNTWIKNSPKFLTSQYVINDYLTFRELLPNIDAGDVYDILVDDENNIANKRDLKKVAMACKNHDRLDYELRCYSTIDFIRTLFVKSKFSNMSKAEFEGILSYTYPSFIEDRAFAVYGVDRLSKDDLSEDVLGEWYNKTYEEISEQIRDDTIENKLTDKNTSEKEKQQLQKVKDGYESVKKKFESSYSYWERISLEEKNLREIWEINYNNGIFKVKDDLSKDVLGEWYNKTYEKISKQIRDGTIENKLTDKNTSEKEKQQLQKVKNGYEIITKTLRASYDWQTRKRLEKKNLRKVWESNYNNGIFNVIEEIMTWVKAKEEDGYESDIIKAGVNVFGFDEKKNKQELDELKTFIDYYRKYVSPVRELVNGDNFSLKTVYNGYIETSELSYNTDECVNWIELKDYEIADATERWVKFEKNFFISLIKNDDDSKWRDCRNKIRSLDATSIGKEILGKVKNKEIKFYCYYSYDGKDKY